MHTHMYILHPVDSVARGPGDKRDKGGHISIHTCIQLHTGDCGDRGLGDRNKKGTYMHM